MPNKPIEFEVDGRPVRLTVILPNAQVRRQATTIYDEALRDALAGGALPEAECLAVLQTDVSDRARETLNKGERLLADRHPTRKEGREICLDMQRTRAILGTLLRTLGHSAEAQAERARFDFYISTCVIDTDGVPYFQDRDYYDDDPLVIAVSTSLRRKLERAAINENPETKWLVSRGMYNLR
jgi:hypothetical protein